MDPGYPNKQGLYGESTYPPMFDNEPPPLDDDDEDDGFADFASFEKPKTSSNVDEGWSSWSNLPAPSGSFGKFGDGSPPKTDDAITKNGLEDTNFFAVQDFGQFQNEINSSKSGNQCTDTEDDPSDSPKVNSTEMSSESFDSSLNGMVSKESHKNNFNKVEKIPQENSKTNNSEDDFSNISKVAIQEKEHGETNGIDDRDVGENKVFDDFGQTGWRCIESDREVDNNINKGISTTTKEQLISEDRTAPFENDDFADFQSNFKAEEIVVDNFDTGIGFQFSKCENNQNNQSKEETDFYWTRNSQQLQKSGFESDLAVQASNLEDKAQLQEFFSEDKYIQFSSSTLKPTSEEQSIIPQNKDAIYHVASQPYKNEALKSSNERHSIVEFPEKDIKELNISSEKDDTSKPLPSVNDAFHKNSKGFAASETKLNDNSSKLILNGTSRPEYESLNSDKYTAKENSKDSNEPQKRKFSFHEMERQDEQVITEACHDDWGSFTLSSKDVINKTNKIQSHSDNTIHHGDNKFLEPTHKFDRDLDDFQAFSGSKAIETVLSDEITANERENKCDETEAEQEETCWASFRTGESVFSEVNKPQLEEKKTFFEHTGEKSPKKIPASQADEDDKIDDFQNFGEAESGSTYKEKEAASGTAHESKGFICKDDSRTNVEPKEVDSGLNIVQNSTASASTIADMSKNANDDDINDFDDFQDFNTTVQNPPKEADKNMDDNDDGWAAFNTPNQATQPFGNTENFTDFSSFTNDKKQNESNAEVNWAAFSSSDKSLNVSSKADKQMQIDDFGDFGKASQDNFTKEPEQFSNQGKTSNTMLLLSPCFPKQNDEPIPVVQSEYPNLESFVQFNENQRSDEVWSNLSQDDGGEGGLNVSYTSSTIFRWMLLTMSVSFENVTKKWKHSSKDTLSSLSPASSVASFDADNMSDQFNILVPEPAGRLTSLLKPTLLAQSQQKEIDLQRVPSISSLKKVDSGSDSASETTSLDLDFFSNGIAAASSLQNKDSTSLKSIDLFDISLVKDEIPSNNAKQKASFEDLSVFKQGGYQKQPQIQNDSSTLPFNLDALNNVDCKQDMSDEAKRFLEGLENLKFMTSTVLMFPSGFSGDD